MWEYNVLDMKFSPASVSKSSIGSPQNNKNEGVVEFTIFEENGSYVGVCLTLDIVVEGDNYEIVRNEVIDAARVHIETVRSKNLSEELLNRPAPAEYWEKRNKEGDHLVEMGNEKRSYSQKINKGLLAPTV